MTHRGPFQPLTFCDCKLKDSDLNLDVAKSKTCYITVGFFL